LFNRRTDDKMSPVRSAVIASGFSALAVGSYAAVFSTGASAPSSALGGALVALGNLVSGAFTSAAQAVTNPLLALIRFLAQIIGLTKFLAACADYFRRRKKRKRRLAAARDLGSELDELAKGLCE
jgi:hypothetical protein